jgi:hypothetical protein
MKDLSEIDAIAKASEILLRDAYLNAHWGDAEARGKAFDKVMERLSDHARKKRIGILKKGLHELLRDLPHTTSIPTQRRLFALVEQETGLRMLDFIDRDSARLKAILARGRIRGEAEYRLVRSHVDVLEGDPGQAAALEEAYRLIGEFETRLMKPPRR